MPDARAGYDGINLPVYLLQPIHFFVLRIGLSNIIYYIYGIVAKTATWHHKFMKNVFGNGEAIHRGDYEIMKSTG